MQSGVEKESFAKLGAVLLRAYDVGIAAAEWRMVSARLSLCTCQGQACLLLSLVCVNAGCEVWMEQAVDL